MKRCGGVRHRTLTFSHMLKEMSYGHFKMEDEVITKKKV